MILNYTNNPVTFKQKLVETFNSMNIQINHTLYEKLTSVKIFKSLDEDGFVFYLHYNYTEELYDNLKGDLISVKLMEGVRSVDIGKEEDNITVCLILDSLEDLESTLKELYFNSIEIINLVIETQLLESIEDIMITQEYTDIISSSGILSLCSINISNLNKVEKPAFYMYLATLCSVFLDSEITCQIYTDFDIDIKMLKEYITILMKSTPTDLGLKEILVNGYL